MKVKHTKGPWVIDGEYRHSDTGALLGMYVAQEGNGRVGQTFANCLASDAACRANARLFAAAPDLLDVARMLIACVDQVDPGDEYIDVGIESPLMHAARAAIAKALGESA